MSAATAGKQSQALGHLRVLDLSQQIAGPYCTKLMAGFGAEVIKIEPPRSGDPMRHSGPYVRDQRNIECSIPFLWLHTGKKSVTLDINTDDGQAWFKRLVSTANVVVESGAPGQLAELGLGYETLQAINPRLVMTSIANFGQSGPYKDYRAEEITWYALSGLMYATGDGAREPLCSGPALSQLTAGMKAYIATLMGCFRSAREGKGDWIDVSVQEAALDNFEIAVTEYLHAGKIQRRNNDEHPLVPWRIFPCRDGHAAIIGGPIRNWLQAAKMFDAPELYSERYAHMEGRIKHRDDVRALMTPWLMQNDKKTIFHAGQKHGLAWGYLATLDDALHAEQTQARGYFTPVEHPDAGTLPLAGAPFRPAKTPWQQTRAPRLGEHTKTVLTALIDVTAAELDHAKTQGVV